MTEPVMVGGAPAAAGNKRALILLGVAAAIAVVALVLPKLLFGGGDEAFDDFDDLPAGVDSGASAGPTGDEPGEVLAEPARTTEVFSIKNPFTPLIDTTPVAAIAPAPVVGNIVAPVGVAPAPVAPVSGDAPTGAPVDATAPASTGGPATEPSSGQRVALLEVFLDESGTTIASVRVNDTLYEVTEGTAFATRYQAVTLSVADGCGQFLYGDNRFRLCEGEELLK